MMSSRPDAAPPLKLPKKSSQKNLASKNLASLARSNIV
jgi:hypothetical protein